MNKYDLKVICDGLSALNTVNTEEAYIKLSRKSVDIISITSEVWSKLNFNIRGEYVYAHQEDHFGPLSLPSTLDCRVDLLAKKFTNKHIISRKSINF